MVLPDMPVEGGNVWFVDGDKTTGGGGKSWEDAFGESDFDGNISALNVVAGDVVYVAGRTMAATDTDPTSYTTNLTINVPQVSIIGVSRGRTQGGLPQFKVGATTTSPVITIAAPGVLIANIGINGAGATGGGILLNDDGGTTYSSFGWSVIGCHFKNCVGTTATNAATGGAIQWSANGGAWQGYAGYNRFYKNVGDIVLKGTSSSVPQDIVIEHNEFSGPAANTDCNLFLKGGGDGINGLVIRDNTFSAMPALGGTNDRYMDLTGCVGILANNYFASIVDTTGTVGTFAAAGTLAKVPATMFIVHNYGETTTADKVGEIIRT
jgi:hypothetical protein